MHPRPHIAILLGLVFVALVQTPPSAQTAATDVPRLQFEKYTLPNGLEVILSQNRRVPSVAVNLWYHVGPANEEPGRTGFAHLFEHMMFQGSKHVPADGHFKLLESAGATGLNGTTNNDRTNYFETVPANQLPLALWLESDRMGYLLEKVDQTSLSNQQDVVRNERRQSVENDPDGLAFEALVQMVYPKGHPYYGNVIGSHEDIQAVQLDDVNRFFREYYAPNNATLALVGDFEVTEAKALVEKYFGTLKRGPAVDAIEVATPPITSERRRVLPSRVELPRVYMTWLAPPIFKPGNADGMVASTILGNGAASRLYKKLVYERQIAQDVAAWQESMLLTSTFQLMATARPGHTAEELERAIEEELAAMRAQPPTTREIEQARNTIETSIIGGLERLNGVANRLNLYNHYLGNPDFLEKDIQRYRAVTPASVHAFVKTYLAPGARVVLHAVPGQPQAPPPVPTPPKPASGTGEGGQSINAEEPWRQTVPAAGPARPLQIPTPTTAVLPNGLTLILSERRGLPLVSANLVFKSGSDSNPQDRPGLASFMTAMLDQGTSTRGALQIADEVAHLGARLGTSSSMDAITVSASSLSKNFPAVFNLLADITLRPAFPAEEIERQRADRLGQLVELRDRPPQLAGVVMASALYGPRHPYGYAELGTEPALKAVTRADMTRFWEQHFVPNNAALVVAGDITMDELRSLATKAFGAWQRGNPPRPSLGSPATTMARIVIVDKPGSPQTQLRVAAIGAPRSSPDFRALQVMNNALGGLFSSRINMNLREQHGYSYGAYSQFIFRRSAGPFSIGGGVRTDATAPAVSEIFKEVAGIREMALSAEELQKAKDALANSLPGAFETNGTIVGSFANIFIYDLGADYYTRYASEVNAVTAEQALDVARRYVVPERLVVIAVGDRAAIEGELRKLNLGTVEIRDLDGKPAS
jgi:zinc protease